jgi:hypothetical protein
VDIGVRFPTDAPTVRVDSVRGQQSAHSLDPARLGGLQDANLQIVLDDGFPRLGRDHARVRAAYLPVISSSFSSRDVGQQPGAQTSAPLDGAPAVGILLELVPQVEASTSPMSRK